MVKQLLGYSYLLNWERTAFIPSLEGEGSSACFFIMSCLIMRRIIRTLIWWITVCAVKSLTKGDGDLSCYCIYRYQAILVLRYFRWLT